MKNTVKAIFCALLLLAFCLPAQAQKKTAAQKLGERVADESHKCYKLEGEKQEECEKKMMAKYQPKIEKMGQEESEEFNAAFLSRAAENKAKLPEKSAKKLDKLAEEMATALCKCAVMEGEAAVECDKAGEAKYRPLLEGLSDEEKIAIFPKLMQHIHAKCPDTLKK